MNVATLILWYVCMSADSESDQLSTVLHYDQRQVQLWLGQRWNRYSSSCLSSSLSSPSLPPSIPLSTLTGTEVALVGIPSSPPSSSFFSYSSPIPALKPIFLHHEIPAALEGMVYTHRSVKVLRHLLVSTPFQGCCVVCWKRRRVDWNRDWEELSRQFGNGSAC